MERNQITDEGAAQLASFYTSQLASAQHPLTRYEAHVQLGLVAWRGGRVDELRHQLRAAAGEWLRLAEAAGPGMRPQSTALASTMPVLLVALFGDQAHRERLARLPATLFTPDDTNPSTSRALGELVAYFAGRELDANAWGAIASAERDADPVCGGIVAKLATGARAVAARNEILASRSLDAMVQDHAWLAHEGGWAKLAEGLLSFWALALAQLARAEGLELEDGPMAELRALYVPVLDPEVRRAAPATPAAIDVLPSHAREAARVVAARLAAKLGLDLSADAERLTRIEGACANAAADVARGAPSTQRLPFFVLVEGRPRALLLEVQPDRRFDVSLV